MYNNNTVNHHDIQQLLAIVDCRLQKQASWLSAAGKAVGKGLAATRGAIQSGAGAVNAGAKGLANRAVSSVETLGQGAQSLGGKITQYGVGRQQALANRVGDAMRTAGGNVGHTTGAINKAQNAITGMGNNYTRLGDAVTRGGDFMVRNKNLIAGAAGGGAIGGLAHMAANRGN